MSMYYHNSTPRRKNATEMLDEHVCLIIQNGDYVDSNRIARELVELAHVLKNIDSFRTIQSINRNVDCAIDIYWFSRCVHIYSDMEKFIVESLGKWRKQNYTNFEEIGVGSLLSHAKVVELFSFYSGRIPRGHTFVKIQLQSIIDAALKFVERNRNIKIDKNGESQSNFTRFLQMQLSQEYNCPEYLLGIHVEFKDLFHKIIGIKNREINEINKFTIDYFNEFRAKLNESLKSSSTSTKDKFIWDTLHSCKIDLKNFNSVLYEILSKSKDTSFLSQIFTLYKDMLSFDKIFDMKEKTIEIISKMDNISFINFLQNVSMKMIVFKSSMRKKLQLLIGCLLWLILKCIRERQRENLPDTNNEPSNDPLRTTWCPLPPLSRVSNGDAMMEDINDSQEKNNNISNNEKKKRKRSIDTNENKNINVEIRSYIEKEYAKDMPSFLIDNLCQFLNSKVLTSKMIKIIHKKECKTDENEFQAEYNFSLLLENLNKIVWQTIEVATKMDTSEPQILTGKNCFQNMLYVMGICLCF